MKHSCTFFTINLGIKKPIPKLSHHSIFFSSQPKNNFKLINTPNSIDKFNFDNFSYYLTQPTLTQPSLAPKGKAVLFILAPVCGYDPKLQWSSYENIFKEFIYDVMEKRDHIPIRSLIEEEIIISPVSWGKEYNLWENIILGPSHNFFQVNGFRIPNKSKEMDNLFFVGGSTIPGAGVPTCITSGELVAERIIDTHHPFG